jgi:hypothetical protein
MAGIHQLHILLCHPTQDNAYFHQAQAQTQSEQSYKDGFHVRHYTATTDGGKCCE